MMPVLAMSVPADRYRLTTSSTSPSSASRPFSNSTARVHSALIAVMLWLTKRTVRPLRLTWPIFPRHFCWNWASPTASTSSTTRISGSRCDATANASRVYMPLE